MKKVIYISILFFLILTIISLLVHSLNKKNYRSFDYTFRGIKIHFPITVGEAIEQYHILPHSYTESNQRNTSVCPPNVPINTISELFYVDKADDWIKPPKDSLSKNVYALKFCFTENKNITLANIKSALEKSFNKTFRLNYTKADGEPYFKMSAQNDVDIIIEFYPETSTIVNKEVYNPKAWAVSFCYNLSRWSIEDHVQYERNYDAQ